MRDVNTVRAEIAIAQCQLFVLREKYSAAKKAADELSSKVDFKEFGGDYDALMDLQQDVADWKDAINDKKDLIRELEDEEISYYVT